eukprot:3178573-Alexandrium_andersonii.AAC.1
MLLRRRKGAPTRPDQRERNCVWPVQNTLASLRARPPAARAGVGLGAPRLRPDAHSLRLSLIHI